MLKPMLMMLCLLISWVAATAQSSGGGQKNNKDRSEPGPFFEMGMYYFKKRNYSKALYYLHEAYLNNPEDSILHKLYFLADKLDLELDKVFLFYQMKRKPSNLPPYNNKKTQYFFLESGSRLSPVDTIGNMSFFHLGLQHQLNKTLNLYHGYSFITQSNYWGSISQNQYYVSVNYKPRLLLDITAGLHYINSSVNLASDLGNENRNHFTAFVSANRKSGGFDFYGILSHSYVNKTDQVQYGAGLAYAPFGNLDLVLRTYAYLQHQSGDTHFLHKHSATFKIPRLSKRFSYKVQYLYANTTNFNDRNAYIVNNSPDKTIDQLLGAAYWEINPKITVYASCQNEKREDTFNSFTYRANLLFAGLAVNLSRLNER